jgi:hypothetical protein
MCYLKYEICIQKLLCGRIVDYLQKVLIYKYR